MRHRVDLFEATMQGWSRLDPQQRERFFQAGLKAALRLDRREFRAWLLRRVRTAPLAAPIDPARFSISDADIAIVLRSATPETTPTSRNRLASSSTSTRRTDQASSCERT